jgi:amino-acid N-acetyltransferase
MGAVTISLFGPGDTEALEQLLRAAELPVSDITPELRAGFLVARADDVVIGAAGLEQYADVALLRSVVVASSLRGTGLGKRLVDAMEAKAQQAGLHALYLLTETASDFFARLGYRQVERAAAPSAIRATRQFSELCPVSSVFMMKKLN